MSKDDAAPGLLSKMVRFVRSPSAAAPDSETAASSKDDALNRQLLKDMMERKRQNDFVRKREFDMLRKLRKKELTPGSGGEVTGRPSFFQSSMMSRPDERASTLKKIDEIEAQMSMQWWKNKGGDTNTLSVQAPLLSASSSGPDSKPLQFVRPASSNGYLATVPVGLQVPVAGPFGGQLARHEMPTEPDLLRTQIAPIQANSLKVASSEPKKADKPPLEFDPPPPPLQRQQKKPAESSPSSFSESKMTAMQVDEFVAHDAELEESAIRFANGDDAGAEAGIQELLAPGAGRALHMETWLSLFDFYRATAQADKFDQAALDFAEHFGRSAPQWFSMPALVEQLKPSAGTKPAGNGPAVDWICPSVVGVQTIAALRAALGRATMPWRLDWSNLKSMDDAALEGLMQVFSGWASQPVQLRFIKSSQLQKVLTAATPVGDTTVSQRCWQLRLQALRVMHEADEFELVALDFCMTYELSPPAWSSPACECKMLETRGDADPESIFVVSQAYSDSALTTISGLELDSRLEAQSSVAVHHMKVELSGQIHGDATDLLDQIEAKLVGADSLTISCAKLIRVDFSAAGALLNWVSARHGENRTVQFVEVHRLVAAFFGVMGITEQAKVILRRD